jgi:valyl-tRNA synthetase
MYVKKAREAVVKDMEEKGLIEKIDTNYLHRVGVCYKCKTVLEPLPLEQWYVKVTPLIENANRAVDEGLIRIYPQNFVTTLKQWYAGLRDWNISRQNVWGIQIPVWYEVENPEEFMVTFIDDKNESQSAKLSEVLAKGFTYEQILSGIQKVVAPISANVVFEDQKEHGKQYLPETDTFDTWFSSGQWPYVTLKTTKPGDFEKFYPTSVMETGYDILKAWVSRMIMLGLYVANGKHETDVNRLKETVPFQDVVLHGLVNDPYGKKMSKSKGNVVNPLEVADQYGADAVRFALVYGTALGNDQAMSYPKLDAARKFANKLWNIARFFEFQKSQDATLEYSLKSMVELQAGDYSSVFEGKLVGKIEELHKEITKYIDSYQFNLAAERLYQFIWHEFADFYIEEGKKTLQTQDQKTKQETFELLTATYGILLALLHPFMPFITEEIYQKMPGHTESLMIASWPHSEK